MPRRGTYFLATANLKVTLHRNFVVLLAQENSKQKEGHPLHRPLRGFPALLTKPGGCGTRAARSDSPRRLPPACLR